MRSDRPLVGRARELAELSSALDMSTLGRGALILLAGEPGIGKSRLSEELAERALDRGVVVHVGRCWEVGGAPAFWPWVEILRSVLGAVPDDELKALLRAGTHEVLQLVPEIAESAGVTSPSSIAPVGERFRLFDAVASLVLKQAQKAPLLFVFEDLHAADPPTLELLAFLAQRISRARLLILGTYRDVEARLSPVTSEILGKVSRKATTIQLKRLDRSSVAELVQHSELAASGDELIDRVFATTEGNPLFVDEVVHLLEARDAERIGGSLPIPDGVRGAIGERVARLEPETKAILEIAAVAGREFSLPIIAEVAGRKRDDVRTLLSGPARADLLSESSPGKYVFSHVLIRDVLYDEIEASRRSALHLAFADVLEGLVADELTAPLAEIAHHLTLAGPSYAERALQALKAASQRSLAMFAYEDAIALLERALELMPVVEPQNVARRFEMLLEIGRVQIRAGHGLRAKDVCFQAADIARQLHSPDMLAEAALTLGAAAMFGMVDQSFVSLLQEALGKLPLEETGVRARLMARLAAALQPAKDHMVPIRMAQEAVDMARRVSNRQDLLLVLHSAGSAVADLAPPELRLAIDSETVAIATELGDKLILFRGQCRLFWDHLEFADLPRAMAALSACEALASEFRLPHLAYIPAMLRHAIALLQGRFEEAKVERTRAEAMLARVDEQISRYFMFADLGAAIVKCDTAGVAQALSQMDGAFQFGFEELWLRGNAEWARSRCGLPPGNTSIPQLAALPVYSASTAHRVMLADLAAAFENRDVAEVAYLRCLQDVGRLDIWGMTGLGCQGPAERGCMMAALTLERWADAERHYKSARATGEKVNARPAIALLDLDYARGISKRNRPEDAKLIQSLVEGSAKLARELGMNDLAVRAEAMLSSNVGPGRSFGRGRYVVQRELGRGGQKIVYLVHDESLGRDCALAWIDSASLDQEDAQRLRAEAITLARMKPHPNLVTVFDIGEEMGRPFVVSEHVEGGDLEAETARGAVPAKRALQIVKEILTGLIAVHSRGVVHRDLKPANVWLDEDGHPKIGDFGVALVTDKSRRTMSGIVTGTAEYASPEQLMNKAIDGRSDLYSLGCVLYQLLTGRTPFVGPLVSQISQHLHAQPTPPSTHDPSIDPALDKFVMKLIAKDPAQRPATAQAALQELDQITARDELGELQAQKLQSLGDLVAGIAHEINTPLGALQANMDVLQRAFGILNEALQDEAIGDVLRRNERVARALATLERTRGVTPDATHRIAGIVKELKSFARLDQASEERVDLHECLESTLGVLRHELGDRITLVRNYGEIPKVRCRPQEVNQVFFNLITNAIQAIKERGTITLTTWRDADAVLVKIADDGAGIAKEHLSRIFDPGFTTKGVGVGVGLGLSIAFRAVHEHGGSIAAESEPGRGSSFTVKLPIG